MPKGQRVIIFIGVLFLTFAGYIAFHNSINALGDKGIIIMSSLIMLSFVTLFTEHFFTRPTDVIASSISILLLLSPLHNSLSETGIWYWVFWVYNFLILIIALFSLLFLDQGQSSDSKQNRFSAILKKIAIYFGNGKFLWFSLSALCILFYVDSQSSLFLVLFGYSIVLLLINPKKAICSIASASKNKESEIAKIFGIHSTSVFLACMYTNNAPVARFDIVGFSTNTGGHHKWKTGLVIKTYELNKQRWLKILTDKSLQELHEKTAKPTGAKDGSVYLLKPNQPLNMVDRLVGTTCEGATIEKLKFEYAFNVPIEEGQLLEVYCNNVNGEDVNVLYQVVQGITDTEVLESHNEAGLITVEAVQLGVWNSDTRSFDRFGWVPQMNSPVYKTGAIEVPALLESEYKIGDIPGTNFPVFINLTDAVTHHLAVLGVTGSGKSVFTRNLLKQIANEDIKIICVDFTNEYGDELKDLIGEKLVHGETAKKLFKTVDDLGAELDKFANNRLQNKMDEQEKSLRDGFGEAITKFVNSDSKASLFELPDVTNSTGILEYTKWFFKILFELAKSNKLCSKKVCVVLEEAHTIIPEWNFIGSDDKRPKAVVNSISQIALQGRKYGIGFIVIAQRTANVSKTVLTQCNSVIAFQQFDKTSADFLGGYMGSDFVSSLTRLKPRHAIAVGKAFSSGTPMIFQVPEINEQGNGTNESD